MANKTLTNIVTDNPVTAPLDGSEPFETVVSAVSAGGKLRQLSFTPINPQTISYQLVLIDQGKVVTMNSSSSITLTIPSNATVAFLIGTTILIRRLGTGGVTMAAAGGVTIQKKSSIGFNLSEQFAQCVIHKIATNTWHLAGEIALV